MSTLVGLPAPRVARRTHHLDFDVVCQRIRALLDADPGIPLASAWEYCTRGLPLRGQLAALVYGELLGAA